MHVGGDGLLHTSHISVGCSVPGTTTMTDPGAASSVGTGELSPIFPTEEAEDPLEASFTKELGHMFVSEEDLLVEANNANVDSATKRDGEHGAAPRSPPIGGAPPATPGAPAGAPGVVAGGAAAGVAPGTTGAGASSVGVAHALYGVEAGSYSSVRVQAISPVDEGNPTTFGGSIIDSSSTKDGVGAGETPPPVTVLTTTSASASGAPPPPPPPGPPQNMIVHVKAATAPATPERQQSSSSSSNAIYTTPGTPLPGSPARAPSHERGGGPGPPPPPAGGGPTLPPSMATMMSPQHPPSPSSSSKGKPARPPNLTRVPLPPTSGTTPRTIHPGHSNKSPTASLSGSFTSFTSPPKSKNSSQNLDLSLPAAVPSPSSSARKKRGGHKRIRHRLGASAGSLNLSGNFSPDRALLSKRSGLSRGGGEDSSPTSNYTQNSKENSRSFLSNSLMSQSASVYGGGPHGGGIRVGGGGAGGGSGGDGGIHMSLFARAVAGMEAGTIPTVEEDRPLSETSTSQISERTSERGAVLSKGAAGSQSLSFVSVAVKEGTTTSSDGGGTGLRRAVGSSAPPGGAPLACDTSPHYAANGANGAPKYIEHFQLDSDDEDLEGDAVDQLPQLAQRDRDARTNSLVTKIKQLYEADTAQDVVGGIRTGADLHHPPGPDGGGAPAHGGVGAVPHAPGSSRAGPPAPPPAARQSFPGLLPPNIETKANGAPGGGPAPQPPTPSFPGRLSHFGVEDAGNNSSGTSDPSAPSTPRLGQSRSESETPGSGRASPTLVLRRGRSKDREEEETGTKNGVAKKSPRDRNGRIKSPRSPRSPRPPSPRAAKELDDFQSFKMDELKKMSDANALLAKLRGEGEGEAVGDGDTEDGMSDIMDDDLPRVESIEKSWPLAASGSLGTGERGPIANVGPPPARAGVTQQHLVQPPSGAPPSVQHLQQPAMVQPGGAPYSSSMGYEQVYGGVLGERPQHHQLVGGGPPPQQEVMMQQQQVARQPQQHQQHPPSQQFGEQHVHTYNVQHGGSSSSTAPPVSSMEREQNPFPQPRGQLGPALTPAQGGLGLHDEQAAFLGQLQEGEMPYVMEEDVWQGWSVRFVGRRTIF